MLASLCPAALHSDMTDIQLPRHVPFDVQIFCVCTRWARPLTLPFSEMRERGGYHGVARVILNTAGDAATCNQTTAPFPRD